MAAEVAVVSCVVVQERQSPGRKAERPRAATAVILGRVGLSRPACVDGPRGATAKLELLTPGRRRACVRPTRGGRMAAGLDEIRGPGPSKLARSRTRTGLRGVAISSVDRRVITSIGADAPTPPAGRGRPHPLSRGPVRLRATAWPRRSSPSCWQVPRRRASAASARQAGRARSGRSRPSLMPT